MAAPTITPLPVAPSVNDDPADFDTKSFAFVGALAQFTTQINALVTWLNSNVLPSEPITVTEENYDLLATHAGKYIRMVNENEKTITVRPESMHALPVGGVWNFRNAATGAVSIMEGEGVTVTANAGGSLVFGPDATISILRVSANQFDVFGQTVAA